MPLIRRSLAALFGVLLLQLTLLGSGTLCALHHVAPGDGAAAHAGHEMSTMREMHAASGTTAGIVVAAGADPMNTGDCGQAGQHGCGSPWAPGQCASMSACDVSVAPASIVTSAYAAQIVTLAVASPASVHDNPVFAPELPPPRA